MNSRTWLMAIISVVGGLSPCSASAQLRILPSTTWRIYSDKVSGGASWSRITKIAPDENVHHGVKIDGELIHKFVFPFSDVQAFLNVKSTPEDARNYSGVRFWVRGDGHMYAFQVLTAAVKDYNFFSKTFRTTADWTLVEVLFKDLSQRIPPPWGKKGSWTGSDITAVGIQADSFAGSFWLEIGDVSFFQ